MCLWKSASGNSRGAGVRPAPGAARDAAAQTWRGRAHPVLGLKVVQGDAGEVRDNHITRGILGPPIVEQVLEVLKGLGLGFAEILPGALMLDQQRAFPEQVN